MGTMRVKKVYRREDGKKVMEINVLPGKYCTFQCVFCPIPEKGTQTEGAYSFPETEAFLGDLAEQMDRERPDVLFLNSLGESSCNDRLGDLIDLGHRKGAQVSLYSNGYLLGDLSHAALYAELQALGIAIDGGSERVTAERAPRHIADLLRLPADAPVLYLERRATSQGRAIEWRETHVRADRFSLEAEWSSTGSTLTAAVEGTPRS